VILIGQYDSPFVRRVAVTLRLYQLAFEHYPWSVFADAERIRAYTPLVRVPILILDDGEVVLDSAAIIDHLDKHVGSSKALIGEAGRDRRRALKVCAIATGVAEKAVALVYEQAFHSNPSSQWTDRCKSQIGGALDTLEAEWADKASPFWFGESIGHSDIAVACALRFTREAHPSLFADSTWPSLTAHSLRCEGLASFQQSTQKFSPPN
jgi:glutathione S-transferase